LVVRLLFLRVVRRPGGLLGGRARRRQPLDQGRAADRARIGARRARRGDQLGVGGGTALGGPAGGVLLQPGRGRAGLLGRALRGEGDDRVGGVAVVGLVLGAGEGGDEVAVPGEGVREVGGAVGGGLPGAVRLLAAGVRLTALAGPG